MVTPKKKAAPKKRTTKSRAHHDEAPEVSADAAESAAATGGVMDMTPPEFAARAQEAAKPAPRTTPALAPMPLPSSLSTSAAEEETPEEEEAPEEEPAEEAVAAVEPEPASAMTSDEPDFGLGIGDILRSEEEEISASKTPAEGAYATPAMPSDNSERLLIEDILNRGEQVERPVVKKPLRPIAPPPAQPAPMRVPRMAAPPSRGGGGALRTAILVILVLLCFGAAATGVYVFLKKTGSAMFPESAPAETAGRGGTGTPEGGAPAGTEAPATVSLTFVTGPTAPAEASSKPFMTSRVIETDVAGSDTYPATGETTVAAGKASGTITVINTTANEYTFVPTTRFLSADGVLFRLKTSTLIPPNGSVDAQVAADQAGPDGDIGPTTFTIPGLPADLQKRVTGKSEGAMTGGSGKAKAATDKDIAAAKTALIDKLKTEALDNFGVMIGEGEKLHPDLVTSKELSATVPAEDTVGASFPVKMNLRFRVLLIPESMLATELAKTLKDALPEGASTTDYTLGTATYAVQAYDAATETAEIKVEVPVIRQ